LTGRRSSVRWLERRYWSSLFALKCPESFNGA
jgi:hypothetical protein